MKSPTELARKFLRQWGNQADLREARLLGGPDAWPISLPIGRPQPGTVKNDLDAVKQHVQRWRDVRTGTVLWKETTYRATDGPVEIPALWQLSRPSEWIVACGEKTVRDEFAALSAFVERTDPIFHSLLVRRRSLWRSRSIDEVVQATELALCLKPGCAAGNPLRTLSLAGIDTKFFERNEHLVRSLLDIRFDGEVSRLGLEAFLDAPFEGDHWLLVADLDGSLLPFRKMRVPSFELHSAKLRASRILIVENETSLFQLPPLPDTLAILGAGFDLSWMDAPWLLEKQVAYWGDLDTWGLKFLARARSAQPTIEPLLMTAEVFREHANASVPEPVSAGGEVPEGLTPDEAILYETLLSAERGRLEQEFLPIDLVHRAVREWSDFQP